MFWNLDWADVLLISVLTLLLSGLMYIGYVVFTSEKIVLIEREWTCTKREMQTSLLPIVLGKTTMLLPTTAEVCVLYEKIK